MINISHSRDLFAVEIQYEGDSYNPPIYIGIFDRHVCAKEFVDSFNNKNMKKKGLSVRIVEGTGAVVFDYKKTLGSEFKTD